MAWCCTRGQVQGVQSTLLVYTGARRPASAEWQCEERGECGHGHLVTEEVAPVAGGNPHWLAESGVGPGCSVAPWPAEGLVTVELCLLPLLVGVVLQPQAATPPAPSSPLVRGAQLGWHLGLSWGEHFWGTPH